MGQDGMGQGGMVQDGRAVLKSSFIGSNGDNNAP